MERCLLFWTRTIIVRKLLFIKKLCKYKQIIKKINWKTLVSNYSVHPICLFTNKYNNGYVSLLYMYYIITLQQAIRDEIMLFFSIESVFTCKHHIVMRNLVTVCIYLHLRSCWELEQAFNEIGEALPLILTQTKWKRGKMNVGGTHSILVESIRECRQGSNQRRASYMLTIMFS